MGTATEMKYTFPLADPLYDRFVQLQMGRGKTAEVKMEMFVLQNMSFNHPHCTDTRMLIMLLSQNKGMVSCRL